MKSSDLPTHKEVDVSKTFASLLSIDLNFFKTVILGSQLDPQDLPKFLGGICFKKYPFPSKTVLFGRTKKQEDRQNKELIFVPNARVSTLMD
ncbi:MAG: hypothetical protein QF537_02265 [SAR324 cluster bacterium]|nr:hypothetical protein [SAR324 cluster bacterium]MDP6638593.1 hypothetical protein [SAR324 cluster bacterium]